MPDLRLLILRHEPFEHLGYFEEILKARGTSFVYKDLGDKLSMEGYAGLVIMGGPQSANDAHPGLQAEMELIREAVQAKVSVLGICLGAQLIAKALGAAVYSNRVKEIGWEPVHFTPEGIQDPLFTGLESPSRFFHWHGETFDLPSGATWLAYSDDCRNQAFRYAGNVCGIQFHPEITPGMIVDWSAQPANCGDIADLSEPIDPHAADTAGLARHILHGWLSGFGRS